MIPSEAFPCRLTRARQQWPNHPAIIEPGQAYTFAGLDDAVSQRAAALQAQGLGAGTWTALRMTTSTAGVIDWLAILRAGARVLPVSERMPEPALEQLLAEHGIAGRIPAPGAELQHTGHAPPGEPASSLHRHFRPDAPCAGVATSGSTGAPRIAAHSYANYVRSAQGAIDYLPLSPPDRYLLSLPLFHVGGLGIVFRCLEAGVPMVVGGRSEDATFLAAYRVSHVSMVETQLHRLLRGAGDPLPKLRCVLLGGGPVATELLEEAQARGLPCYMSYGLTEMTAQVATWPALHGGGRILPYRALRIDHDEIRVRGDTLCLGYLDRGTVAPLTDADGWFSTGDLGHWQAGRLTVFGRRDNQFISGGENIQPEAIERVLREHPAVREAVVVPRHDREFGQRPVAFVKTGDDALPATDLRAWVRARLSPHMTPVAWYPLPDSGGLKVRRAELIERAERLRDQAP
ncbi:AMP-binding protein [Halorhodospira halophila]|uniref:O-succinylbenzoate-CoA ligase n=1 Tax=Halorhodospira halophila (strain DSM 244 / SL1) TaxID=349124 RepID=A1WW45_HALHL|nr:AMP-binding protein [Halorhodospira halophila]ABM61907.1 O-succinylbenzoate-CoA ligase [Halorhodospira halophila SL1]MBK1729761.1 2-succinylbenzoate--CoA ligase [Halorhodospira halophila]